VAAPHDGTAVVRLWQAGIDRQIVAHVPMRAGTVQEEGDFALDGVTFPAAEIRLEFLDPGGDAGTMFPTGNRVDVLDVAGVGRIEATLIDAGNPTAFVAADALGLSGSELQADVNGNPALLARLEAVRAQAAVAMGIAATVAEASATRLHVPKLAFVAPPQTYVAAGGHVVDAHAVDLNVRIVSMGLLHHAMTGTGAVAVAVAAAVPGTLVQRVLPGGHDPARTVFGHPSGTLTVGAQASLHDGAWTIAKVVMSRSARRLMEGWVRAARMPLREALAALEPLWDEKSEPYGAVLEALDAQAEKRWQALGLDVGALR